VRDDIRGRRKPHNEELHNLYSSPGIMLVKSSRMSLAGHVAYTGQIRNTCKILVEGNAVLQHPVALQLFSRLIHRLTRRLVHFLFTVSHAHLFTSYSASHTQTCSLIRRLTRRLVHLFAVSHAHMFTSYSASHTQTCSLLIQRLTRRLVHLFAVSHVDLFTSYSPSHTQICSLLIHRLTRRFVHLFTVSHAHLFTSYSPSHM
jgi:hypothetical protein